MYDMIFKPKTLTEKRKEKITKYDIETHEELEMSAAELKQKFKSYTNEVLGTPVDYDDWLDFASGTGDGESSELDDLELSTPAGAIMAWGMYRTVTDALKAGTIYPIPDVVALGVKRAGHKQSIPIIPTQFVGDYKKIVDSVDRYNDAAEKYQKVRAAVLKKGDSASMSDALSVKEAYDAVTKLSGVLYPESYAGEEFPKYQVMLITLGEKIGQSILDAGKKKKPTFANVDMVAINREVMGKIRQALSEAYAYMVNVIDENGPQEGKKILGKDFERSGKMHKKFTELFENDLILYSNFFDKEDYLDNARELDSDYVENPIGKLMLKGVSHIREIAAAKGSKSKD